MSMHHRKVGLFVPIGRIVVYWCNTNTTVAQRGGDGPAASGSSSKLVDGILQNIQSPSPNEFPNPESVIRFFITQVQTQSIDAATKVFPIRELYDRHTWETLTEELSVFNPRGPLPGSPFRNISNAMQPLRHFDDLSLKMLGVGVWQLRATNMMKAGELEQLQIRLDRSRLANLRIQSIEPPRVIPVGPKVALGYTERIMTKVNLACDDINAPINFFIVRLGTNWRIIDVQFSD